MAVENRSASTKRPTKRSNTAERIFTGAHTFLYRLSGGKLGGRMGKAPVLLLTTTGRKTGQQRTKPLLYLADGERLILVASAGGAPKHPTWWLNLQANPEAEVEIGRKRLRVTAIQADQEERKRLWPLVVSMFPNYARYQKKITREMPVVILHPVEGAHS